MSRYLMVLWSGGGGVPPPLAIAKRLVRAGHEVTVLAPRSLAEPVRATGAILEPYRRAPEHDASDPKLDLLRDWEVSGMAARMRMRDNVVFGTAPAICDDVLALADENRPDAIVTDYLMVGAYVAAEKAGIPLAALMHTIYTQPRPGVPPFGPGLKLARGRIGRLRDAALTKLTSRFLNARLDDLNTLRDSHSLPQLNSVAEMFRAADRMLVLTSSAFDYPGPLPANARWAGAVTDPDLPPPSRVTGDDARKSVLVSLSTTFQRQGPTLERIIEALRELPVDAVVTSGPAIDPSALPTAPNVRTVRSVPHHELMPTTDLVITHGGHGTVSTALRHGVPVVCLPFGRDQKEIAARLEWHGAGIGADADTSVTRLRRIIGRALDDPSLRDAAERLATRMAADDPDIAVHELEKIATTVDH